MSLSMESYLSYLPHCTHVLASMLRSFVVGREREGNGDGGGHMEVGSARTRRLATG